MAAWNGAVDFWFLASGGWVLASGFWPLRAVFCPNFRMNVLVMAEYEGWRRLAAGGCCGPRSHRLVKERTIVLSILGSSHRMCDGVSRRNFLRIGALGLGGLALPQVLRAAQGAAGVGRGHKAVIMIFLQKTLRTPDFFDLKMDAPAEIRGEFRPIKTSVSGIEICEHLPLIAKEMDKCAVIRSIVGAAGGHDAVQCLTGRTNRNMPPGGWPSLGSVLSKLKGAANDAVPPFIGLSPKMGHMEWADSGTPGFLGVAHAPLSRAGRGRRTWC